MTATKPKSLKVPGISLSSLKVPSGCNTWPGLVERIVVVGNLLFVNSLYKS